MAFIWNHLFASQIFDESDAFIDEYPNMIKISGLPFMLQGWNATFVKKKDKTGRIIYRLEPYVLYHIIPIVGVTISKQDNYWIFTKDRDRFPLFRNKKLFGKWDDYGNNGMTINPI